MFAADLFIRSEGENRKDSQLSVAEVRLLNCKWGRRWKCFSMLPYYLATQRKKNTVYILNKPPQYSRMANKNLKRVGKNFKMFKIATNVFVDVQKAQCVLWTAECHLFTEIKRKFLGKYRK